MSSPKKPPLGAMPIHISEGERIKELAQAITRYAEDDAEKYCELIAEWSVEISQHCALLKGFKEIKESIWKSMLGGEK